MKKTLWEQIWLAQDRKCATCDKAVELVGTAKNSYSLKIVCQLCYQSPQINMVILDEFG